MKCVGHNIDGNGSRTDRLSFWYMRPVWFYVALHSLILRGPLMLLAVTRFDSCMCVCVWATQTRVTPSIFELSMIFVNIFQKITNIVASAIQAFTMQRLFRSHTNETGWPSNTLCLCIKRHVTKTEMFNDQHITICCV